MSLFPRPNNNENSLFSVSSAIQSGGNQPTIRMIQHTHTVNKISGSSTAARTSKRQRESGQVRRGQERPDDWFPLAQTPTTFFEEANWLTKLAAAAFTLNRPSNRKNTSQKAPPVSLFATCCFSPPLSLSFLAAHYIPFPFPFSFHPPTDRSTWPGTRKLVD
jgi:hypothetical protein